MNGILENTATDEANGILRHTTIAVPVKYLSNFWKSLEITLINYKVELKLKCTNHCILSVGGADNNNANSNNIILTIILYVPVVTLSPKDSQKLSKRLSKGFEKSVY